MEVMISIHHTCPGDSIDSMEISLFNQLDQQRYAILESEISIDQAGLDLLHDSMWFTSMDSTWLDKILHSGVNVLDR